MAKARKPSNVVVEPYRARVVRGPHPPAPSSTGRAYYLFLRPPRVVAGSAKALELLGGSWTGHDQGRSPEGFSTVESALNAAAERGLKEVVVIWE